MLFPLCNRWWRAGSEKIRMRLAREGIPASPGIVIAPARVLRWEMPRVPAGGALTTGEPEAEIRRFREACEWAREQTREIQRQTEERLGPVEARIFEPQLLMLQDTELVERTESYIRDGRLSATRAWEVRVLEWESQWSHTANPMVLDKLNDLADVHARVLRRLLDLPEFEPVLQSAGDPVIIVAPELAPSVVARIDPERVLGLALDGGTRTSHASILARSLGIPAVVSLGAFSEQVPDGAEMILDGRTGRAIVRPGNEEKRRYREKDFRTREWEQEQLLLAHLEPITLDGVSITLRANLDLPGEAVAARAHGAEGVGLFRSEFLVIGRSTAPGEDEQYAAYRAVAEAFSGKPVVIRAYDLGGDKFPPFLHMLPEENPFLGWRAIRVCLDEPALFHAQLRALLRAGAHGDIRVMLPLVNEIGEIQAARSMLELAAHELSSEGYPAARSLRLGAMIETPAAALCAQDLAPHVDFFSIGTNDLVQYTLAVDRGNARLAKQYNPFHPAVARLIKMVVDAGRNTGTEVSVCGELAANPLGVFMLIGMGVEILSVGTSALAEVRKVIRSTDSRNAARAVQVALRAFTPDEVLDALTAGFRQGTDVSIFGGTLGLPVAD